MHGARIGSDALIGMNAVIMDNAVIGAGSIVGALCFVPTGMEVPPRSVVVGNPAKVVKEVSDEMLAWYSADVGFMDPNVGVNVVYGVKREDDPARFEQLLQEVQRDSSAYDLAGIFSAVAVIDPRESRQWLSRLLEVHQRRPVKGIGKHLLGGWPTTF